MNFVINVPYNEGAVAFSAERSKALNGIKSMPVNIPIIN